MKRRGNRKSTEEEEVSFRVNIRARTIFLEIVSLFVRPRRLVSEETTELKLERGWLEFSASRR